MESAQSRSLIRETFTQPFDKARFQRFIRELLNHLDESKAEHWNKTYVKEAFRRRINRYQRLGTYVDPGGEPLDVLVVHLEKDSSLERARTSLRNFVAYYLSTRGGKEAALVAFVSPHESDWRFSFVKMEYQSAIDESGTVSVSETLTPARRYSFLVGANEHSHTAQKQFLPLLENDDYNPTLAEIEEAFSIDRVTEEFFDEYDGLYRQLKEAIDDLVGTSPRVRKDFERKRVDTVNFAKKLLGQIVFLYFLQKKGWFGVERDAKWGTGPKNYLRILFQSRERIGAFTKSGSSSVNFFNDVLEPLFYEALAKGDREDNYYGHFHCRIPFLNGGLFDPINDYDWLHTDIPLPDELFSNEVVRTDGVVGTGILDVFDRYNFTVNEAEPLEKEVAVDPEMLGKVFERLLDAKERKSKGSFYTPREIVHYMCRQSLLSYLEKELGDAVPRADVETLLSFGEQAADFELARLDKSTGYKPQLPQSVEVNAALLDRKLEDITVCDPAVGSGAFLVGMMNEIVRSRGALTSYFRDRATRSPYDFKHHAIHSSLYGVDVDPGAVEIAKLRLWLSLVVDEDDIKEIRALPNLDYKIMQGDSLVEEFEGLRLFDERLIERPSSDLQEKKAALNARIGELSNQFFDLHGRGNRDKQTRRGIEKEIAKVKRELKKLDAPAPASALPAQRDINDLFSEAQAKLPQLTELRDDLFKAKLREEKKEIRTRLSALEWEITQATVRDDLRELAQKMDHVKHEFDSARRKKEPATILADFEHKLGVLRAQKHQREKAAEHLEKLREAKIKPFFLWRLHFLEVFQENDGFDVVIGNPPYIRVQTLRDSAPKQVEYLKTHYSSASKGNFDIYVVFVERGLRLLQAQGDLSYILPHKFFNAQYGQPLRSLIASGKHLRHVVHFGDQQVFPGATNYVCLLFLAKAGIEECRWVRPDDLARWVETFQAVESILPATRFTEAEWNFAVGNRGDLLQKLEHMPVKLGDVAHLFVGLQTDADDVFIVEVVTQSRSELIGRSLHTGREHRFEAEHLKPFLKGSLNIRRYVLTDTTKRLIFPYETLEGRSVLIRANDYAKRFPLTWAYLKQCRDRLGSRGTGMLGDAWHGYVYKKNHTRFEYPKLLVPSIASGACFAADLEGDYYFVGSGGGGGGGYGITVNADTRFSPLYLLALLNSSPADWFLHQISTPFRGGYIALNRQFIAGLPIPEVNFSNRSEKARHDELVKLVKKMLAAKKDWAGAEDDYEKRRLRQLCDDLDREIDRLVYQLYELTEDEIAIVEESTKR
jgi:type I restriction-modification system DNA methylase subunit